MNLVIEELEATGVECEYILKVPKKRVFCATLDVLFSIYNFDHFPISNKSSTINNELKNMRM
ncbi:MAG: hypothetical protein ACTSUT_08450 [Promethearchaeota archaeon]